MSFTTPKTWTVGEILTAADMNTFVRDNVAAVNLRGNIGYAELEENTAIGTNTTIILRAIGVVVPAGRVIRTSAYARFTPGEPLETVMYLELFRGSGRIQRAAHITVASTTTTSSNGVNLSRVEVAPTAGTYEFQVQARRLSGPGGTIVDAGPGNPVYLLVEDLGPA